MNIEDISKQQAVLSSNEVVQLVIEGHLATKHLDIVMPDEEHDQVVEMLSEIYSHEQTDAPTRPETAPDTEADTDTDKDIEDE